MRTLRTLIHSIILATAATGMLTAAVQAACTVYEHGNFQGKSRTIADTAVVPWIGQDWNDRISSVQTSNGCYLRAFQHMNFGGNAANFSTTQFVGQGWNDQISSVACECGKQDNSRGQCVVYEHHNFQGKSWAINRGKEVPWVGPSWNDQISSVYASPSCGLMGYQDKDFGGNYKSFRTTSFVGQDWNDRISAMRCVCIY